MTKKFQKIKQIIIAILIPLIIGGLSALLTMNSMKEFAKVIQPPLSPPAWLFPIAWTILYILMGIASYLIYTSDSNKKDKITALKLYGIQLTFNFFWSIIFFNLKAYTFAVLWLFIMWIIIIALILKAKDINKTSALLLVPYILWTTFALYLNVGVALLN